MSDQTSSSGASPLNWGISNPVQDYWIDAWQRSILFMDVLRQRGNIAKQHNARLAPHVLTFTPEVVLDGRTLARPVNYGLLRIIPPAGVETDPRKRPFIVVDPRAGHGPGIGGMKHDSEIGVALAAGHPCYFVGFLPTPVPGQTIEDVCNAEAVFIKTVAGRHSDADGKPVVIGNCQAGWQLMIMAALNPDLAGPIMLAGSPLSYWAGVRGKNPLRYLGGNLGGTWLTALAGDLGHGIFDGADLVKNFESMNPANTLWQKSYNVYSKVDTEAQRYLEFETWWGSPVLLNAEEMQWIADNLFVGNKLTAGDLRVADGTRIDLRNIRSPIIVFCSWGDDITPPQQALGWITDLYDSDEDLVANGQTIVYTMHQSIGHLGIFVSAKVATKEHEEFATAMDMIDLAPPGLYEAVITDLGDDVVNPELVQGRYLFRLELRTLADIRAVGNNDAEDDLRFAAAARLSDVNLGLYRNTLGPVIRATTTEQSAETMRKMHPARVKFSIFSDDNPLMQPVKALADTVRAQRKPVSPANPLLAMEQAASAWITSCLQSYGAARDALQEHMFLTTYGSPVLQALVGLGPDTNTSLHKADRDLLRQANEARLRTEMESRFETGGPPEAMIRALIYIGMPARRIDERGFTVAKAIREARHPGQRLTQPRLKELFTEQFLLLKMDSARAIEALPELLPTDLDLRRDTLVELRRVVLASGPLSDESSRRLAEVTALFALPPETTQPAAGPTAPPPAVTAPAITAPAVTVPVVTAPAAEPAPSVNPEPAAAMKVPASSSARIMPPKATPPEVAASKAPPPKGANPKTPSRKVH